MKKLLMSLIILFLICGCANKAADSPASVPEQQQPQEQESMAKSPLTQEQIEKLEMVGERHMKAHTNGMVVEATLANDNTAEISFKGLDDKYSYFTLYVLNDMSYIDLFDGNERKVYGCEDNEGTMGLEESAETDVLDTVSNLSIIDYKAGVTRVKGTYRNPDYDPETAQGHITASFEENGTKHNIVIAYDLSGWAYISKVDDELMHDYLNWDVDIDNKTLTDTNGNIYEYKVERVVSPDSTEYAEIILKYNDDGKVFEAEYTDEFNNVVTYEFLEDVAAINYEIPENVEMVNTEEFSNILLTMIFGNLQNNTTDGEEVVVG